MEQQSEETAENPRSGNRSWVTPIRANLLIIALLIAILNGGIIYLACVAITSEGVSDFVAGALIGLLPVGITALAGLGTTLLNDK